MDQFAKCFYDNCFQKPEHLCRCKGECVFICKEHDKDHKMQSGEHSYNMIYIYVDTVTMLNTIKQNIQAINALRDECLKEFSCLIRNISQLHSKMIADIDSSDAFLRHSMKILIESPMKQVEHNWKLIKEYNKNVWKYIPKTFCLKKIFMAADEVYNQKFSGYFILEKVLMISKEKFNQELDYLTEVYMMKTRNVDRIVREAVEVDEIFEVDENQEKVKNFEKSQDFYIEASINEGILSTLFQAITMTDDFQGEISFQAENGYRITEAHILVNWETYLLPKISESKMSQDSKSISFSFTVSIPHKRFWAKTITLNLTGKMTKIKTIKKIVLKNAIKPMIKKIKESVPMYQSKEEAQKAAENFLLSKYT
ncbi:hypothetical protein SteCoe_1419 [Stentor coeruleus]|uniref:Uncharacterized protein n=1 Tax=Stentor coeruleus TaxID=5963 RepID=A0A1R2D1U7_9CILI|nr:hypothetical protein SteCoe_1419 [Stentor coeruleus]